MAEELNNGIARATASLQRLGRSRPDNKTQRHLLLGIVKEFDRLSKSGVKGEYDDAFFNGDSKKSPSHAQNARRIKSRVKHANDQFGVQMRRFGAKYDITDVPASFSELVANTCVAKTTELEQPYLRDFGQETQTYTKAIDWVFEVAKYSYGEALPGMIAPSLILTLHKDQCQHWAAFANAHVSRIKDFCFKFCHLLLEHISSEDIVKQL